MDTMDVKDYTETISVRLTQGQVELLKRHAENCNKSQSELIRYWIENADLMPIIPPEIAAKLRRFQRDVRGLLEGILRDHLAHWGWR